MTMLRELTCREAAKLIFGALDAPLSEADQAVLDAHVAECEACERVLGQTHFMRNAMARWRGYVERDEPGEAESR
jgi:predicted anti-sigma-YlaC factor YlaD